MESQCQEEVDVAVAGEKTSKHAERADPLRARHASPAPATLSKWRWPASLMPYIGVASVIGAAWLVRAIGITRNYDIFIDEVTYTRIADNLATGSGLVLYGTPFDLHPPAAFAIYGAAIRILALHGSIGNLILGLRPFAALIGSITCGVACALVAGLANWRAGLIAGAVATLDPFEIFYDSRVMLEAPAQLASVLAIFCLVKSIRSSNKRRSWAFVILGGTAAGLAICTKEYFGLVMSLTLILSLATGWVTERRKAAVALATMCSCYLLSESLVIASSGFQTWRLQVLSGFSRLIGAEQISGFNSSTVHVSLVSRLAANVTHFGITYLILGLGAVIAAIHVVRVIRRRAGGLKYAQPGDRGYLLVALWTVSAAAYLAYATLFGTLEEQMYYLLLIPAICMLTLSVSRTFPHFAARWRIIAVTLLSAIVIADSAVWVAVHRTSDNEYSQLLAWAPEHIPDGSTVSVAEFTAQFLMQRVILGQWVTVPSLIEHHADYILLSTTLVSQGYGLGTPQFERYLQGHATVVFEAKGPSEGELILYDVRSITGAPK
jgi:uncharacterized membrane protein